MRILIVYFTMTGRTKKISKAIASSLTNHEIKYGSFEIMGKLSERLKIIEKFNNGDYSAIENELESLSDSEYDLLLIGMPTHGGFPPKAFDKILTKLGNLTGKKVVVFNTARITGTKALNYMEAKVKEAGAEVIGKRRFKGLFRLGLRNAIKFGEFINKSKI